MRYIQSFSTSGTEQEAIDNNLLGKPYVAYIEDGKYIDWNTLSPTPPVPPEPVYSAMPLTFEIISGGTIGWKTNNESLSKTIQYSKNEGEWFNITSTTGGTTISVITGDIIKFRGNNNSYDGNSFSGTSVVKVYGNIMSLISPDNFYNLLSLTAGNTFKNLFYDFSRLNDAENLIIPATTLANSCYEGMFFNCLGLVLPPSILPATTLSYSCYSNMFSNCPSLIKAPELPATELAEYCYTAMFANCTSLTTAPELPSTLLLRSCYGNMFIGCISLNYIKCLAINKTARRCTQDWMVNVAQTGTFVKHPNTTWTSGSSGIPTGWTVIDADI